MNYESHMRRFSPNKHKANLAHGSTFLRIWASIEQIKKFIGDLLRKPQ